MSKKYYLLLPLVSTLYIGPLHAEWKSTGYIYPDIHMDNGVTYFSGFTTDGTCQYNRLELNESGDYFGKIENAKRMMSMILAARFAGKKISLGYNDQEGPACKVAQVRIMW